MAKRSDTCTNETKSSKSKDKRLRGDDKPEFIPDKEEQAEYEYVNKYLQFRLKEFVNFFERYRARNRDRERYYTYVIIVTGASISFVNVFTAINWPGAQLLVSIISAGLGAAVTILTSITQFEKFRQDWINHKVAASQLRRQYYLWKASLAMLHYWRKQSANYV